MPPVSKETLLRYCEELYDGLHKKAKKKNGYDKLYEGKVTELFASLGLSSSHYAKIFNTLYETGAIELVRRGARNSPTQIALHERPTAETLQRTAGVTPHLTQPSAHDKLSQRVSVLEGRLQGIELAKVIAHQERRIKQLEVILLKGNK